MEEARIIRHDNAPKAGYKGNPELRKLRQEIDALPEFSSSTNRESMKGLSRKLDNLMALDSVQKYRVVFIGQPGMGKTTTICNWLGLLSQDRNGKKTRDTVSLLTTASGHTTVSEVHIRQVDEPTHIDMEFCDLDIQMTYIRAFAECYWNRFPHDGAEAVSEVVTEEDDGSVNDMDPELYRFVRNMAGLKDLLKGTSEKSKKENEEILKMMSGFSSLEEFTQFVIDRIDVENRTVDSVVFDGEDDFEDWLKKTVRSINYGEYPGIPLMRTTTICISRDDMCLNLPDCIKDVEVIDTKGLNTAIRPDLYDLLLADDTICILMDDLKQVPSMMNRNLIKNTFRFDYDMIKTKKVSILAKSTIEDLGSVNGADGDPELGKEIKRAEIEMTCKGEGVPYPVGNTLFIDPVEAYTVVNKREIKKENGKTVYNEHGDPVYVAVPRMEYDEDIGEEFSRTFNRFLCKMIKGIRSAVEEEIPGIRDAMEGILELEKVFKTQAAKELADQKQKVLSQWRKFVGEKHYWGIADRMLYSMFEQNSVHWARIKKLNRIYGAPGAPYGESWADDIYTSIYDSGLECFRIASAPVVNSLNEMAIDVRNESLRAAAKGLKLRMDEIVKDSATRVANEFRMWALKEGFHPLDRDYNVFWEVAQDMRGNGYTRNIKNHYRSQIQKFESVLSAIIAEEIEKLFKEVADMYDCAKI